MKNEYAQRFLEKSKLQVLSLVEHQLLTLKYKNREVNLLTSTNKIILKWSELIASSKNTLQWNQNISEFAPRHLCLQLRKFK